MSLGTSIPCGGGHAFEDQSSENTHLLLQVIGMYDKMGSGISHVFHKSEDAAKLIDGG